MNYSNDWRWRHLFESGFSLHLLCSLACGWIDHYAVVAVSHHCLSVSLDKEMKLSFTVLFLVYRILLTSTDLTLGPRSQRIVRSLRLHLWSSFVRCSQLHSNLIDRMTEINALTFYKGRQTAGRRSIVPQLSCVGGSAQYSEYHPDVVQCVNRGDDGFVYFFYQVYSLLTCLVTMSNGSAMQNSMKPWNVLLYALWSRLILDSWQDWSGLRGI